VVWVCTTAVDITLTTSSGATALPRAPNDDCTQGGEWFYKSFDATSGLPTQIDLCPATCAAAQSDLNAAVSIHFTCLGEI
jgi:hypothetical protein